MNRLPVPPGALSGSQVLLEGEQARKARTVLRLRPGDAVELFDGAGKRALAKVSQVGEQVLLEVGEVREEAQAPALWIAQGLCKGDKLELVIQKATELGAAGVVPFRCERAVVKLEGDKARERVERWRKIALEAARQCGRADAPEVAEITDLAGVLARPGKHALLYEGEQQARLAPFLDASAGGPATLLIGPEGGFAPGEVEQARAAGAAVVGLGPRILRTETVALAALAIALHRRGELG